jgi:hypothetical protein
MASREAGSMVASPRAVRSCRSRRSCHPSRSDQTTAIATSTAMPHEYSRGLRKSSRAAEAWCGRGRSCLLPGWPFAAGSYRCPQLALPANANWQSGVRCSEHRSRAVCGGDGRSQPAEIAVPLSRAARRPVGAARHANWQPDTPRLSAARGRSCSPQERLPAAGGDRPRGRPDRRPSRPHAPQPGPPRGEPRVTALRRGRRSR